MHHYEFLIMYFLEKGPYGRPSLAEKLGISEGKIRIMLNYLKCLGLLRSMRAGHVLTERGKRFWKKVKERIKIVGRIKSPIEGWPSSVAGLCLPSKKISEDGMEERDLAVRYGAIGALIFKVENGRAKLLGKEEILLEDLIDEELDLEGEDGKLLIIVGAEDVGCAYISLVKTMMVIAGDPFEIIDNF